MNGDDWCNLATIVLIGAGQLSHPLGYKGSFESRPRSTRSKLFLSQSHHLSKQAFIQTIIQIMNILSVFVLFAILLKCVTASGEDVGAGFEEAVNKEFYEFPSFGFS